MRMNSAVREPINRDVDLRLLKNQVETLGGIQLRMKSGTTAHEHLQGLWNMLQDVIDDLELGKESILHLPEQ